MMRGKTFIQAAKPHRSGTHSVESRTSTYSNIGHIKSYHGPSLDIV